MTVLKIKMATLRRLYDLPSYADEAAVRAAMRAAPPLTRAQAASKLTTPAPARPAPARPAPRPTRPRLTDQTVAAMSPSALQAAQRDPLADDERRLVNDEIEHRTYMALTYPTEARAAGYPAVRRDLASRSGSTVKGF